MTCDNIDKVKEEKCTYDSIERKIVKNNKHLEWVGSVTNETKEKNRIGKYKKWLSDNGETSTIVATPEVLTNIKQS